jgi:hypothetical protein
VAAAAAPAGTGAGSAAAVEGEADGAGADEHATIVVTKETPPRARSVSTRRIMDMGGILSFSDTCCLSKEPPT